jgi:hypothetical protein
MPVGNLGPTRAACKRTNEKDLSRQLPLRRDPLRLRARSGRGHQQVQLLDLHQDARFWKAIVKADAFRLLQGEDALVDYQFGGNAIHHLFCSRCGVKTFGSGELEELGGKFYAINVACLDDAMDEELAQAPVTYEDGRNDRWDQAPAETRYL